MILIGTGLAGVVSVLCAPALLLWSLWLACEVF
jgi:hypothetical protein